MALRDDIEKSLEVLMETAKNVDRERLSKSDILMLFNNFDVEYSSSQQELYFKFDNEAVYQYVTTNIQDNKLNALLNYISLAKKLPIKRILFARLYNGEDIFEQVARAEESLKPKSSHYSTLDATMTFENYVKDENNKTIYNICHAAAYGEPCFMMIVGLTGTGKTHIASAVINHNLSSEIGKSKSIFFFKKKDFFHMLNLSADTSSDAVEKFKTTLINADILVFDDFQNFLDADSQFYYNVLFEIIDVRYSTYKTKCTVTILTSHEMPSNYRYNMKKSALITDQEFLKCYSIEAIDNKYYKIPKAHLISRLSEYTRTITNPTNEMKINFVKQLLLREGIYVDKVDITDTMSSTYILVNGFSYKEIEMFRMIITYLAGAYRELKQFASTLITLFKAYNDTKIDVAEVLDRTIMNYNALAVLGQEYVSLDRNLIYIEQKVLTLAQALGCYTVDIRNLDRSSPPDLIIKRSVIIYDLTEVKKILKPVQVAKFFDLNKSRITQLKKTVEQAIADNDPSYIDKLKILASLKFDN